MSATPRPWDFSKVSTLSFRIYGKDYTPIIEEGYLPKKEDAELIVKAVNAHELIFNALKRMQEIYSIGNGNEIMCYCDDYKAPEICEHCQTKKALALAEGKE
jgi:hypothetical protein